MTVRCYWCIAVFFALFSRAIIGAPFHDFDEPKLNPIQDLSNTNHRPIALAILHRGPLDRGVPRIYLYPAGLTQRQRDEIKQHFKQLEGYELPEASWSRLASELGQQVFQKLNPEPNSNQLGTYEFRLVRDGAKTESYRYGPATSATILRLLLPFAEDKVLKARLKRLLEITEPP